MTKNKPAPAEAVITVYVLVAFFRRMRTHISTREGGEELELFERVSLGCHKVKEDLKLAASQESPF